MSPNVPCRRAPAEAFALYLLWTGATWLLEGRILTLLRPEAVGARLAYVLVANMLIGTVAALWLIRRAARDERARLRRQGFSPARRTGISVVLGFLLGLGAYLLQGPPSFDPIVIANGFAQTLTASIAEILVCWVVLGAALEALLARWRHAGTIAAAIIASLAFGLYHIGHSPPFNAVGMIALLTGVGLVTSLFFFVSREIYGTIAFHNFQAVFGVVQALVAQGLIEHNAAPQAPLYAIAVIAPALLIVLDRLWLRRATAAA
jgi:hypothetical protein